MGAADSKLAFRKSVFRLYEDKNIPVTENEFWELFWTLPESMDDIFSLIGANDIRRTRDTARDNIATLIDKVTDKMELVLKAPNFPSEQHSINHLLNCCRVLTRFIPFIFESQDCNEWEDQFFWTPRQVEREKKNPDDKPEYDILPSRGEKILTLTMQAMFLAGFTLPISLATKESKVNYAIWENGVGSTIPMSTFRDNEANRIEVLRLFTVLLSKSMYVSPTHLMTNEDAWLRFVTVKTERKIILVILCSLINTVCNYDPTGWVPYNHVVNAGPREQLVNFCLIDLLILLDYRSPQQIDVIRHHDQNASPTADPSSHVEVLTLESPDAVPKSSVELEAFTPGDQQYHRHDDNAFRHYLSKLHRTQDFQFLMDGFNRLIINPMTAVNTYLPGSTKRIGCYIDVIMLCWRLLEINPRFIKYLLESDRILDLTVALIFHSMDNKDKPSQIGLVRMCAFMLQTLSSNKEFSIKLNKPFTTHSSLPSVIRLYAFNGSYADFLIISIFRLIATTQGKLSTLYPALTLTISNISPYLTNLGVTTSTKLLSLFHSMASPSFILADENNYILTSYLLEAFNNVIHFQYENNPNLIYSIVLQHQDFEKLDQMTFESAVTQVERARASRQSSVDITKQQEVPANSDGTTPIEQGSSSTEQKKDETSSEQKEEETSAKDETSTEQKEEGTSAEQKQEETLVDIKEEEQAGKKEENSSKEEESSTDSTKEEPSTDKKEEASNDQQVPESPSKQSLENLVIRPTRSGFIPSESWMTYLKTKLPLGTLIALLGFLVPQVEEKCGPQSNISLDELMEFLKTVKIDEVVADQGRSIFIRKFQWGEALVIWFRSMMWGQNYVSNLKDYGPWNGTQVKLFQIKEE